MNMEKYMKEFGEKATHQEFKFKEQTYYCTSFKFNQTRMTLTLFTETRTFVLEYSELVNIVISEQEKKTPTAIKTSKRRKFLQKAKKSNSVTLSEEQKIAIKEKFYDKNFGMVGNKFTEEEDELIATVLPSQLVDLLGRKYASITVRKNYIKTKDLTGNTGIKSIFTPEQDELILMRNNKDLLLLFPNRKPLQFTARRTYLKNVLGRKLLRDSKLPHPEE